MAIESRRQIVAEIYRDGFRSQNMIVAELAKRGIDVSRPVVVGDLKAIRARWREECKQDFIDAVNEEVQKVDDIERKARKSFDESVLADGVGDPRFLETVLKCVDRRSKLRGLDAPIQIDLRANMTPVPDDPMVIDAAYQFLRAAGGSVLLPDPDKSETKEGE